uniref:Ubiquitin-like domain-containing protein n=1 Tax=viral metagenome TaxID=1070528 RepID=A0A6C0K117_9ZZZZ
MNQKKNYSKYFFFYQYKKEGSMQVFVRTLTGKTITLDVEPTDTIENASKRFKTRKASLPINNA